MPGDFNEARFADYVDLQGSAQISLSISGVAAETAASAVTAIYDVWSDADCYLKIAASASDVATSTGYLLRANNTVPFVIRQGMKLGAITSGASGTLRLHRVA